MTGESFHPVELKSESYFFGRWGLARQQPASAVEAAAWPTSRAPSGNIIPARLRRGTAGHLAQQSAAGRRIESDAHGTHINLTLMTSVKMNVLGIALIVCGLALICAVLIPKFRSKPASTEDAIGPSYLSHGSILIRMKN